MTARRYSTTTRRCASAVSLCGDRQAAPTYSPVLRVAVSRAGVPPTVGTTDGGQARGAESRPASSTASLPLSGHDGAHCAHRELSVTRKSHGRGGSTAGAPCSGRPLDLTLQERERSGVLGTGRLPPPPPPPVPCPASSRRRHGALPARWAGAAPASPPGDPVPGGSRPPCGDLGPPLLILSPPVHLQALDPAQSVGLAGTGDLAQPAWDCRA